MSVTVKNTKKYYSIKITQSQNRPKSRRARHPARRDRSCPCRTREKPFLCLIVHHNQREFHLDLSQEYVNLSVVNHQYQQDFQHLVVNGHQIQLKQ